MSKNIRLSLLRTALSLLTSVDAIIDAAQAKAAVLIDGAQHKVRAGINLRITKLIEGKRAEVREVAEGTHRKVAELYQRIDRIRAEALEAEHALTQQINGLYVPSLIDQRLAKLRALHAEINELKDQIV